VEKQAYSFYRASLPSGFDSSHTIKSMRSSTQNSGAASAVREFEIRDSTPEDFEALWRMDQECFPPGIAYSRRELSTYMRHRRAFTLVAVEVAGRSIAGFIVAYGGSPGHVITIDVAPKARRSGVGSLLLRAVEDRLAAAGIKTVGLETAVDNVAALSFYKRHGYSVIRTWPRYYSNGVDALVLEKELLV
jgi:[ribosomal protein S18]-alanine N-acetyltransferase